MGFEAQSLKKKKKDGGDDDDDDDNNNNAILRWSEKMPVGIH
jgi:hypothetical protein